MRFRIKVLEYAFYSNPYSHVNTLEYAIFHAVIDEYDAVIRTQLQDGIVEQAPKITTNQEFYIPHKAVIKESSETTKMRVVYDASARADPSAPSLNNCLNSGPTLQNKLWDVLIQQRAFPSDGFERHSSGISTDSRERS